MHSDPRYHVIGKRGQIWPIPMGGSDPSTVTVPQGDPPAPPSGPPVDPASGFPDARPTQTPAPPAQPEPQRQLPPRDPDTGRFTNEDIERIRKEEKDKLYPRISKMEEELQQLRTEREERLRQEQEEQEARAAAEEAARQAELSATERVAEVEQRFQSELDRMRQEREAERALLEREQELASLQQYAAERLAEVGDDILPELRDLVQGTTREEIDASVTTLVARSSAIVQGAQEAMQGFRAAQPGTSVTAPPVGPVEQNESGYQTYSADDLRNMSMADYIKNRDKLLGAARDQRNRGLFGN